MNIFTHIYTFLSFLYILPQLFDIPFSSVCRRFFRLFCFFTFSADTLSHVFPLVLPADESF